MTTIDLLLITPSGSPAGGNNTGFLEERLAQTPRQIIEGVRRGPISGHAPNISYISLPLRPTPCCRPSYTYFTSLWPYGRKMRLDPRVLKVLEVGRQTERQYPRWCLLVK